MSIKNTKQSRRGRSIADRVRALLQGRVRGLRLPGRLAVSVARFRPLAPLAGLWRRLCRTSLPGRRSPGIRRESVDCAFCRRLRLGLVDIGARWQKVKQRLRRTRPEVERDFTRTFKRRRYAGSRNRRYRVHLPTGYRENGHYPLVMVLHGCLQTENDIRRITGFDRLADERGFVVVYPFVTSYAGLRSRNCWGWWFRDEIHRGAGEVEDLWQIIEEVCRDHAIERERIHVAGLSSGAGMSVAMMVSHAQRIASGAAVAGVPFAESAGAVKMLRAVNAWFRPIGEISRAMDLAMGHERRLVPIFIIHSDGDEAVPLQAAMNIRESWRDCFHLPMGPPAKRRSGSTQGTRWEHCEYRDADHKPVIETLFISGKGHGWFGGNPGAFSYPDAPDISSMIWAFFNNHSLPNQARPRDAAA